MEESWIEFIRRATHHCEDLARKHGIHDWAETYRLRKWRFAAKTANATDNRWSLRLLGWRLWLRFLAHRRVGRPNLRWDDDIDTCAGGDWRRVAADRQLWEAVAPGFVHKYCYIAFYQSLSFYLLAFFGDLRLLHQHRCYAASASRRRETNGCKYSATSRVPQSHVM